jgi:mRNA-degrading endonuclease RelE of RelBE toxin-antitoxin system
MTKRFVRWSPQARSDLRSIDRTNAMNILQAIDRYLVTGIGDVKKLRPPRHEFRLRVGDFRILFLSTEDSAIEVLRVLNRKEAYR